MIKKITLVATLLLTAGFGMQAISENVTSLRGINDIEQISVEPTAKSYNKDGEPIARDYVQQPPLDPT